ncbi:hypothetical protein JCM3775_001357 [Rhodotorula graminis]
MPGSPLSPRSPSRRPNLSVVVEADEYDFFDTAMSPTHPVPPPSRRSYPDTPSPRRARGDYTSVPLLLDTIDEGDSFDEKTGSPFPGTRSARRQEVYGLARGADLVEVRAPSSRLRTLALVVLGSVISYSLFYLSTQTSLLGGDDGGGEGAAPAAAKETRWSATLLVQEPANTSLVAHAPGYNPLFPDQPLQFDHNLAIESIRPTISTSEPSTIVFHCRHDDVALCANAYRVLLVGPTLHSPPHQRSRALDDRRVEVTLDAVRDPGAYSVYAWPEHETCDQFNHGDTPAYHQLAVSGTPYQLAVVGEQPLDYARGCMASDDLTEGRWVSKAYLDPEHNEFDSPFYNWLESHVAPRVQSPQLLTDYSTFGYVWAPYACKPHHRSFDEWMDTLKPERLVVFGDSVMRDLFCLNFKPGEDVCKYEMFGDYEHLDKYIAHERSDGGITHLHFHWQPLANADHLRTFLSSLDSPASHVFFNVGLWLTREDPDPDSYAARMTPLVEALVDEAPRAKIVARTMAGAVQSVACFDLWRIQRRIIEPANAAYLKLLRKYPSIQPVNVYPIYNDRPDATQDGRHWQRLPGLALERPEEGAVGYAVTDLIFEGWRLQEVQERVDVLA